MALYDEFIDAIKDRERDIPGSTGQFSHRGTTYACNASHFEQAQIWTDGDGGKYEYRLRLTVRTAAVTGTAIAHNDTVVHRSKNARVVKIIYDPTGAYLKLLCEYEKI